MQGDKEHVTLIGFALDKSGSMGSSQGLWNAAISGTNEFVQSQNPAINSTLPANKTLFGMVLFDSVAQWRTDSTVCNREPGFLYANSDTDTGTDEVPYVFTDIKDFVPLSEDKYKPYGMTALYDAVSKLIIGIDTYIAEHQEYNINVILVIQTDGVENSSKKTSVTKLRNMITECTAKGWKFTFLGADQDACMAASRIGIERSSSVCYSNDATHTRQVMFTMSNAISRHRILPLDLREQSQVSYTDAERNILTCSPSSPTGGNM